MAYTPLLGLSLPVTGTLSGTWGDEVNNSITSLVDSAVAGTTTLSTDADVTLTTTGGVANTAREAVLLCTGARTAVRYITAPAQSKTYTVINATTGGYNVYIRGAGPTAGIAVPMGYAVQVAWNSTDFVQTSVPVTRISGLGTGVGTALAINVGTAGSVVVNGGALGTPASGTLTNATGLPIGTGVSGLGTGVATALAVNVGTAGSPVVNGGALGTPSSGTVTNLTGTASININGTVGATTPAAVSATSFSYSTTLTGGTGIVNLGSGQFYKDASGNVGIGNTVVRTNRLAVTAANKITDNDGIVNLYTSDATATNVGACIGFGGVNSQATSPWVYGTIAGRAESGGAYNGYLQFSTTSVSGLVSEKMRIDTSGNVGIGTASPSTKLDVVGNSLLGGLRVNGANTTETLYQATGDIGISAFSAANILFRTNNGERLRIDSSGNVGIGTASPGSKLQIVTAAASTAAIKISDNTNYSLIGGYAGTSCGYVGGDTGSSFALYAGNSEKMRIDATSGNVTVSTAALLGYGTGSGGTVTQATSKSTAVTLNKPTGQITMNNAALGAGATVQFSFFCSLMSANDTVIALGVGTIATNYRVEAYGIGGGAVGIRVTNISGSSLSEAVVINFAVIKGSTT